MQSTGSLVGILSILVGLADIAIRQGKGLRSAAAGIDRLISSEKEREYHCDGASFLIGYLLGIPSFCYQSSVLDSLKLLQETPDALQLYKQSKSLEASKVSSNKIKVNFFTNMFDSVRGSKPDSSRLVRLDNYTTTEFLAKLSRDVYMEWQLSSTRDSVLLAVGRVLVWEMAPVAAEYLRYGKTLHDINAFSVSDNS